MVWRRWDLEASRAEGCTLQLALYILVDCVADRAGSGASKGKPMRADIVPKRKRSWAEKTRQAGLLAVCDPAGCLCLIIALGEGTFRLFGHSWTAGYIAGLSAFLCWVLFLTLMLRRELLDIKALDDPNDNLRANRLIANRRERSRQLKPPGKRHIVIRFVIEFLKCIAIIVTLPLGIGLAVEIVVLALSDRDVNGAFGSGMAGLAAGALGLVIAMVIVATRIADIED
jgi:hypothetical protein